MYVFLTGMREALAFNPRADFDDDDNEVDGVDEDEENEVDEVDDDLDDEADGDALEVDELEVDGQLDEVDDDALNEVDAPVAEEDEFVPVNGCPTS